MVLMFNGKPLFGPRGFIGPDGNPIGTIISYIGTAAPKDYLVCDGAEYNIADYSELARFFRSQFGASNYFGGDGTTTFAVPNITNTSGNSISCIKTVTSVPAEDIYSIEETRIGTWIDKKPLYRIVISWITGNAVNYDNVMDVSHLSIDKIHILAGTIISKNGMDIYPVPYIWKSISAGLSYSVSINSIIETHNNDYFSNCALYIYLEYTKSTD